MWNYTCPHLCIFLHISYALDRHSLSLQTSCIDFGFSKSSYSWMAWSQNLHFLALDYLTKSSHVSPVWNGMALQLRHYSTLHFAYGQINRLST